MLYDMRKKRHLLCQGIEEIHVSPSVKEIVFDVYREEKYSKVRPNKTL